eukprot:5731999-Prymnesium_polylepis.1
MRKGWPRGAEASALSWLSSVCVAEACNVAVSPTVVGRGCSPSSSWRTCDSSRCSRSTSSAISIRFFCPSPPTTRYFRATSSRARWHSSHASTTSIHCGPDQKDCGCGGASSRRSTAGFGPTLVPSASSRAIRYREPLHGRGRHLPDAAPAPPHDVSSAASHAAASGLPSAAFRAPSPQVVGLQRRLCGLAAPTAHNAVAQ